MFMMKVERLAQLCGRRRHSPREGVYVYSKRPCQDPARGQCKISSDSLAFPFTSASHFICSVVFLWGSLCAMNVMCGVLITIDIIIASRRLNLNLPAGLKLILNNPSVLSKYEVPIYSSLCFIFEEAFADYRR